MSSNTETATVLQGGVAASLVPACTFYPPPHHRLGQLTPGHVNACGWKLQNGRTLVVGPFLGLGEPYFESIKELYLAFCDSDLFFFFFKSDVNHFLSLY